MLLKKYHNNIYKHTDLLSWDVPDLDSSIDGFGIASNVRIVEHEVFKKKFRSDFLFIFLVTKGEIVFNINLKECAVGKNSLIAASPNTIKQMVSISKDARASIVSFTPGFLGKIGLQRNIPALLQYFTTMNAPLWNLNVKDAKLLVSIIKQLHKRNAGLEKHQFGKELLYYTFSIFLYEMKALSSRYALPVNASMSRKETLVANFTALVQTQFRYQRNVQQYAGQLFISPKYLTETVKEITGKNAGEIIDDFVLMESKLLLDDTSLSISQLAEVLNFSNQSFFGKYFKRHTGLSPKDYRNTIL